VEKGAILLIFSTQCAKGCGKLGCLFSPRKKIERKWKNRFLQFSPIPFSQKNHFLGQEITLSWWEEGAAFRSLFAVLPA
jgi:hypothetical protein